MATVVKHKETGAVYVLLGCGFGAFKALKPNWFFGNLVADEQTGQLALVAAADFKGQIGWFKYDELLVIDVDGKTPEEHLAAVPEA